MTARSFSRRVIRRLSMTPRRGVHPPTTPIDFGPLNGQAGRHAIVEDILQVCQPRAIFETGTYLGSTTKWFAERTTVPIMTVEANPEHATAAHVVLRDFPNVTAVTGDSRDVLRSWTMDSSLPKDECFFYLDAHWNRDLPLAEELIIISEHFRDPIVMVDDFQVPADSGYAFDDYGPGKALTLNILPHSIRSSFVPLFPTLESSKETGYRRGAVVLVNPGRVPLLTQTGRLAPLKSST